MEIPIFLAMTAAEFRAAEVLPLHPAWMACHFSSYGTGLSNIPKFLPPGSMLMLNDRIPISGHDPQAVAQSLCDTAQILSCDSILLDFQRPDCPELLPVIRAVLDRALCPVGISAHYAAGFDCPVLVPPIPLHLAPEDALIHWQGHELWLELSAEGTEITVAEEGSRYVPLPPSPLRAQAHQEADLHCHYDITVEEDRILFHLARTAGDQSALIQAAGNFGVTKVLGLWQEMK